MRIFSAKHLVLSLGFAAGLGASVVPAFAPAFALDGTRTPPGAPMAVTPVEAFRSGMRALKVDEKGSKPGEKDKAITSLQYAAEKGHPLAQWKLGRMYADGDGVPRDDLRAFKYFSRIADSHA